MFGTPQKPLTSPFQFVADIKQLTLLSPKWSQKVTFGRNHVKTVANWSQNERKELAVSLCAHTIIFHGRKRGAKRPNYMSKEPQNTGAHFCACFAPVFR